MKKIAWAAWLSVGALLLASAPAFGAASDAWTTTKSKIAVLTEVGTDATDVDVDTVDGVVTLHGKVGSEREKAEAERAVENLDGVKKVRNLLEIVDTEKAGEVQARDSKVEAKVAKALSSDPELEESNIEVASVNAGRVLLSGEAKSAEEHLRAIETARDVDGVVSVRSEVDSPEPSAGETLREGAATAKKKGASVWGSVSGAASDAYITSATKTRLLAEGKTPGMEIDVDTENGVVTLQGSVPSAEAKETAEKEARKVSGVREVRNELVVKRASHEGDTETE